MPEATKNPLYIGSTNYGELQKKYSANQIEQATRRDESGNIFWREGVDINTVPKASDSATIIPNTTSGTPNASDVINGGSVNIDDITRKTDKTSQDAALSSVARSSLQGTSAQIDSLQSQRDRYYTEQQAQTEQDIKTDRTKVNNLVQKQSDEISKARESYIATYDKNILALNKINDQISSISSALEQGIIYEESRPARLEFVQGRASELQKQGNAKLNALNTASSIIQNNITLAGQFADRQKEFIGDVYAEQISAAELMLDLDNDNKISLDADEKEIFNSRIALLNEQSQREKDEIDKVAELAKIAPYAFVDGGVSFDDSLEQAMMKMMPYMSERDKLLFQAELASQNALTASRGRSGSGSGGTDTMDESKIFRDMSVTEKDNYASEIEKVKKLKTVEERIKYLQENEDVITARVGSPEAFELLVSKVMPSEEELTAMQKAEEEAKPKKNIYGEKAKKDALKEMATVSSIAEESLKKYNPIAQIGSFMGRRTSEAVNTIKGWFNR
jgi:hypothetical protein